MPPKKVFETAEEAAEYIEFLNILYNTIDYIFSIFNIK